MVTNLQSHSNGGRPRRFENEDVLAATARLLARHGFNSLTLDIVARELGVSAPAISRRFGSKNGLIAEYLRWTEERVLARFDAVRKAHESPLMALLARYLLPIADRLEEVSPFTGAFEILQDEKLGPILVTGWEHWSRESRALLEAAQAAGELTGFDAARVSRVLGQALGGATVTARADDAGLLDQYAEIFATILEPYVPGGRDLPDPEVARSIPIVID